MAEVGAAYDARPLPRTPDDVLADAHDGEHAARPAARARNKWLIDCVVEDAAAVVSRVLDEAQRDPGHHRRGRLRPRAGVPVEGGLVLLQRGRPRRRTLGPRPSTRRPQRPSCAGRRCHPAQGRPRHLDRAARATIDECAVDLIRKRPYLDYPTLAHGWPIATGVIEGACRHLVKDRMDITGARWGLDGAEAVLKMRAIVSNGDFEEYWRYHLAHEHERVHRSRYASAVPRHLALVA